MRISSAKQIEMPRTNAKISQLWNSLLICDSPRTTHIMSVLPCHPHCWTCASYWPWCLQLGIHTESTFEPFIFIALFQENYPIWQSFWPQGYSTDHDGWGPDARREWTSPSNCPIPKICWLWESAVLCVTYNQRPTLSCVLLIIRRLSAAVCQGSEVLMFLAELYQCPTVELPARWVVTAVKLETLCKRRKRLSNSAKGRAFENRSRPVGIQERARDHECQHTWQEVGSWGLQTMQSTWADR